jgi:hypothetical protein
LLLATPQLLAHAQQDRAVVGDQRRVEHEDRVGAPWLRVVVLDHFGAGPSQYGDKRVVLLPGDRQVGPAGVVPERGVVHREGFVGAAHQDAP